MEKRKDVTWCYIISQTIPRYFDFVANTGAKGLFMLPHSKEMHV